MATTNERKELVVRLRERIGQLEARGYMAYNTEVDVPLMCAAARLLEQSEATPAPPTSREPLRDRVFHAAGGNTFGTREVAPWWARDLFVEVFAALPPEPSANVSEYWIGYQRGTDADGQPVGEVRPTWLYHTTPAGTKAIASMHCTAREADELRWALATRATPTPESRHDED